MTQNLCIFREASALFDYIDSYLHVTLYSIRSEYSILISHKEPLFHQCKIVWNLLLKWLDIVDKSLLQILKIFAQINFEISLKVLNLDDDSDDIFVVRIVMPVNCCS